MDTKAIQAAYKRYANIYDQTFGKILAPGRQHAVKLINDLALNSGRILEVGVGTGLSLPHYRKDLKITGIDISEEMLEKAKLRAQQQSSNLEWNLLKMDAEALNFSANAFDCVAAMYVASVVPNLERFLAEITRVCIPNGDIIIVNHFSSTNQLLKSIENILSPLQKYIGFKPDFSIEPILHYPAFRLVKTYHTNLFGYWKILHIKNAKPAN